MKKIFCACAVMLIMAACNDNSNPSGNTSTDSTPASGTGGASSTRTGGTGGTDSSPNMGKNNAGRNSMADSATQATPGRSGAPSTTGDSAGKMQKHHP